MSSDDMSFCCSVVCTEMNFTSMSKGVCKWHVCTHPKRTSSTRGSFENVQGLFQCEHTGYKAVDPKSIFVDCFYVQPMHLCPRNVCGCGGHSFQDELFNLKQALLGAGDCPRAKQQVVQRSHDQLMCGAGLIAQRRVVHTRYAGRARTQL